MWQIKYEDVFLDLDENQDPELQRESPLFLMNDILAERSTPVTIRYSDKNSRKLGHIFFDLTTKTRAKFEVELYENNSFKCLATLVLESAAMHRDKPDKGSATGYVLTGISNFFTAIKGKKLTELSLGGVRTHPFTSWFPTDGSDGFFQKFQATWSFNDDFVVVPCRNEFWTGVENDIYYSGWMNQLETTNNNLRMGQHIVPFIKLQYVLEQIFKEHGWSVDFSGLNDTLWQRLLLFSAKPITTMVANYDVGNPLNVTYTAVSYVSYRLADHLPAEYSCGEFILQVCRKYGWVPVFDGRGRTCRMVALKEMKSKPVKDWTRYADPESRSPVKEETTVFGFKNSFEGSDKYISQPSFTEWIFGTPVYKASDLPNPYGDFFGVGAIPDSMLVYVYLENQFYKVVLDDTVNQRVWTVFADNIYDESPDDANTVFETKVTTLPFYRTQYRTASGVDYFGFFPYCEQSKYEKFGLRTLLYHGLVDEIKADYTAGPKKYPLASSSAIPPATGAPALAWSNVLHHEYNGTDKGIISYWWQSWCDMISGNENAVEQIFFLPLKEYLQYNWDDIITVNSVPYIFVSIIEKPVKDDVVMIKAVMQRLNFTSLERPSISVYLKLVMVIIATDQELTYEWEVNTNTYSNATTAYAYVQAFADPAGTIPVTLKNFAFRCKQTVNKDGSLYSEHVFETFKLSGQQMNINLSIYHLVEYDFTSTGGYAQPAGHYVSLFELLPGEGYGVI